LQGFPTGWPFQGNRAATYRQIGNAVPFVFGLALGSALRDALPAYDNSARRVSIALPAKLCGAIAYAKKENARNGVSRKRVRAAVLKDGNARLNLKGVGSRAS
jgi:DNA (cytosine-5)-methyltransferase 1